MRQIFSSLTKMLGMWILKLPFLLLVMAMVMILMDLAEFLAMPASPIMEVIFTSMTARLGLETQVRGKTYCRPLHMRLGTLLDSLTHVSMMLSWRLSTEDGIQSSSCTKMTSRASSHCMGNQEQRNQGQRN